MAGSVSLARPLLMMYYTTVSGWMLAYFWKFLTGAFASVPTEAVSGVFTSMLASPTGNGNFHGTYRFSADSGVCGLGLHNGVERITKVMMLCLLVLIVVLAAHSVSIKGGGPGLAFYLLPDWDRAVEAGIGNVAAAAMNQAFFTSSLGIAAIEIFGSYMSDDFTPTGEAVRITALDIPSSLSFPDSSFSRHALPTTYSRMKARRSFSSHFRAYSRTCPSASSGAHFSLSSLTFASFSTVTAVFENLIACARDNFGWSRKKAVLVNLVIVFVLSIPCVLGYNIWSDVHIIGARDVLDSEDFIVSNLLLPGGALVYLLFCVTKFGWGFDNYIAEVNKGSGLKMPLWIKPYFQFILPLLILVILIRGLM